MPDDWAYGAQERCAKWRDSTHPAAWGLIEDFEGQFELDQPSNVEWVGGPGTGEVEELEEGGVLVERLAHVQAH